jgi:hypothetical protein
VHDVAEMAQVVRMSEAVYRVEDGKEDGVGEEAR